MLPPPQKFWMVFRSKKPKKKHRTLESATAEAIRLAEIEKGSSIFILECVAYAVWPSGFEAAKLDTTFAKPESQLDKNTTAGIS